MLGMAADTFAGKTTYKPLYYSDPLARATDDSISQLALDRAGYNKDIANVEGEVAGAQALYKDATPEDMGNLGKIVRQSSADPRDLFSFLATQFPAMADSMLGKLNAGTLSGVDKIGLSGRGYGGRGNARSRFETMLGVNRMGQAAIPLFQAAMNSIIPGVAALSNVGTQNARTAMEAIAQRGVVPLRGTGLSFLPMEARQQASNSQADMLGKIGAANVANIFAMDAEDNWARKLGNFEKNTKAGIKDAANTAASLYGTMATGGLGGGMGGGGNMFSQIFGMQKPGGGGGGGGGSSQNYTPYIPAATSSPGLGYGYSPNYGQQPPQAQYYQSNFGV